MLYNEMTSSFVGSKLQYLYVEIFFNSKHFEAILQFFAFLNNK